MKMVRLTLSDGTKREMTEAEMNNLSLDGMFEAMGGKTVMDVKFFSESGV